MSTPVNMGAVESMGGQFNTNAFRALQGFAAKRFAKSRMNDIRQHNAQQAAHQQRVKDAQQAYKQHVQQQQQNAKAAQSAAKGAQKAYTQGVKSGRVAPGASAPPRVFAMPASPEAKAQQTFQKQQFKNMQSQMNAAHGEAIRENAGRQRVAQGQMNLAHGEALKEQSQRNKTMQGQVNFAHGEAIKEATRRAKLGNTPAAPVPTTPAGKTVLTRNPPKPAYSAGSNIPTPPPTASNAGGKAAPVGPQFANVTPKSNAPFPTHVHPAGSSNLIMPNLTAAQPRPNQFTVGSRNIKGGGIAAMGSKLEEGLATKKFPLPEPRKRV